METIHDWVYLLAQEDRPIIVEGKKDKKALESFDVKNIYTLDKPLYEIIEFISDKFDAVIILTDLDKEGKELYGKLASEFGKRGVFVENKYRNFLLKETELTQIEGLTTYITKSAGR